MATATDTVMEVNGMNIEVLQQLVSAVKKDPGLGSCKFRARNKWAEGAHNSTSIYDFYAARQEMSHRQNFIEPADEPPMLAGRDQAPNPVEYLLTALASCVTTSMVAHAAVRGIPIQELESELEGDIDLRGFLGLSDQVPKGFTDIRVRFRVKTDQANLEQLKRLATFSPVLNTLVQGTKVHVQLEHKS